MIRLLISLTIACLGVVHTDGSHAAVLVNEINAARSAAGFVTEVVLSEDYKAEGVGLDFINNTVQFNFLQVEYPAQRSTQRFNEEKVRTVFAYQAKPDLFRIRVIYQKAFLAAQFAQTTRIEQVDSRTLRLYIEDSLLPVKLAANDQDLAPATPALASAITLPPLELGAELPAKKPESSAELLAQEFAADLAGSVKAAPVTLSKDNSTAAPLSGVAEVNTESRSIESEALPVLKNPAQSEVDLSGSYRSLLWGLGLVTVLGLVVTLMARWWTRTFRTNSVNHQIRMNNQFYLGPKKSLAIVSVAGESILIGITDHSITHIRTLSLLDEDLPVHVPTQFVSELDRQEQKPLIESVKSEEQQDHLVLNDIRDRVSQTLKQLRVLS